MYYYVYGTFYSRSHEYTWIPEMSLEVSSLEYLNFTCLFDHGNNHTGNNGTNIESMHLDYHYWSFQWYGNEWTNQPWKEKREKIKVEGSLNAPSFYPCSKARLTLLWIINRECRTNSRPTFHLCTVRVMEVERTYLHFLPRFKLTK